MAGDPALPGPGNLSCHHRPRDGELYVQSPHTLQLLRCCVCQNDKGTKNLSQQIEKHLLLLWFSICCRGKTLFCTSAETNDLPLVIMQQKLHLYRVVCVLTIDL